MSERKFRIRYADVAATLALVLASTGTAYAVTALPKNSVGSPQLKANAVTHVKLHDDSVTTEKMLDGTVAQTDLADGAVGTNQIADGSISTIKIGAGQITEGHFAPGVVRSVAVQDESLTLNDIAGAQVNVNTAGFSLAVDTCASFSSIPAQGAELGQIAVLGWITPAPEGLVGDAARVTAQNQLGFRICNSTGSEVSTGGGLHLRIITLG